MQVPKIALSPAERELYQSAGIILTKNSVLQKTIALLQQVQEELTVRATGYPMLTSHQPKISRGENYLGLPYVVLDYPRIAAGNDLFFIRSFFWWGNFYSSTLQLAGAYKEASRNKIVHRFQQLSEQGYFIGVNPNPWVHHFEADNYQPINDLSPQAFEILIEQQPHIKIAARWSLNEWDSAAKNLVESWAFLTALVA